MPPGGDLAVTGLTTGSPCPRGRSGQWKPKEGSKALHCLPALHIQVPGAHTHQILPVAPELSIEHSLARDSIWPFSSVSYFSHYFGKIYGKKLREIVSLGAHFKVMYK